MLQWLEDTYSVTAGDVALYDVARGWNWRTRRWETVSGVNMARSEMTRYRIRAVNMRVYTAAMAGYRGVLGQLWLVGDAQDTTKRIRLHGGNELQGGQNYITWMGDFPFGAGFEWHISQGGIDETDVVVCKVAYE